MTNDEDEQQRNRLASLNYLRKTNNPNNEQTGPFTGRCHKCGSNDLWDDNLSYGCNCCGMVSIN